MASPSGYSQLLSNALVHTIIRGQDPVQYEEQCGGGVVRSGTSPHVNAWQILKKRCAVLVPCHCEGFCSGVHLAMEP